VVVDDRRPGAGEPCGRPAAGVLGGAHQGADVVDGRHGGRGHEKVVVRVEQRRALAVHRRERLAGVQVERRLLRHHHRFRLDAQAAMLGHDVEVVHPVAEVVARGRRRRGGLGPQPESDAGLELVVDRLQVDLVVALGDRAVVLELGDVEEPVAVHVPTS
jgi:hypothetical protein